MMTRASISSAKGNGIYIQRGPLEDIASSVDKDEVSLLQRIKCRHHLLPFVLYAAFQQTVLRFVAQDKRGYYIKGITQA